MKVRGWLCGILVLFTFSPATRAGERLTMRVTPSVAIAPADLIVRTMIEANAGNRSIEIIAESPDFYRSSEQPVDGDRAPRTTQFEFRGLPGGQYMVSAVLKGANDSQLARTRQEVNVVESPFSRYSIVLV